MKTIRQRIIDSVFDALKTTSVNVDDIHLALDTDATNVPSLSLEDHGDQTVDEDAFSVRRAMVLKVVADVEGDGGEGVSDAYQSLVAEVLTALMSDGQWNGLADDTQLGDLLIEPTPEAEVRAVVFSVSITITYAHSRVNPFVQ